MGARALFLAAVLLHVRGARADDAGVVSDAGTPFVMPACAAPADDGCLALAVELLSGAHGQRSPARAAELDAEACSAGKAAGCVALGGLFESGNGTLTSFTNAYKYFARGCELGSGEGCTEAAALAFDGFGDPKADKDAPIRQLQRGCEAGSGLACLRLAGLAELGRYVAVPRELYGRACRLGEQMGCANDLGLALDVRGPAKAEPMLDAEAKACEADDSLACWMAADAYFDGLGVVRNIPRAVALYRRACDEDEISACVTLAEIDGAGRGVPKNAVESIALYRKACRAGDDDACARVPRPQRRRRIR